MRGVFLVACAAGLAAAGCGPDPRARSFKVSGTVTFAGQPVADGGITLKSEDPTLAADFGRIENGRFAFLASAGRKRVEVRASREVPAPKGVLRDPRYEDYIPERYNDRSELTVEVVPGGENEFTFELKPGP